MPLIPPERLASLRVMREDNMLFRCDIEALGLADDGSGAGGQIESWAVIPDLTDLPCSVVAMSGDETTAAQQIAPSSNAFVYLPWRYGALVKAKHRVVVRGDIDGVDFVETYGIIYVAVPKTFSVQTTLYCRSGQGAAGPARMAMARSAAPAPEPLGNTTSLPVR